jgi:hypothetical protein
MLVVGEEEHTMEEPQALVVQVVVAPQRRTQDHPLVQVALQIQVVVVVVEDIHLRLRQVRLAVVPVVPVSSSSHTLHKHFTNLQFIL